jgi:hypothetical protein
MQNHGIPAPYILNLCFTSNYFIQYSVQIDPLKTPINIQFSNQKSIKIHPMLFHFHHFAT